MINIKRCENTLMCKVYCSIRVFCKVLFSIILLLAISFVGVTSYKTIDPFDKGYETQDFFGYQVLSIGSNSMYPLMNVGDGAMVKIIDESTEINEGDIVAYRVGEHIIVHRVIEVVNGNSYVTQGDANDLNDGPPIPREDLVGKYKFHIGGMEGVLQYVRTPVGLGLFTILVIGAVFFVDYALALPDIYFRYSKEEMEDENGDEEEETK